jgi:hypothetical protein
MSQTTEIAQLVVRERQYRVRHLFDQLRDCFHPDATVTTSWLSGSAAAFVSQGASQQPVGTGPLLNRLGPPVVHERGARAVVELPSTTTRWIPVNGVEAILESFMRLVYRVEQRGGVWRISDLTSINEADSLTPASPGTELRINEDDMVGLRHSYRFLAYTRSLVGDKLSGDLYGIDRPDEVAGLYDDAFTWATADPTQGRTQS